MARVTPADCPHPDGALQVRMAVMLAYGEDSAEDQWLLGLRCARCCVDALMYQVGWTEHQQMSPEETRAHLLEATP